jgi:hypothetical protein
LQARRWKEPEQRAPRAPSYGPSAACVTIVSDFRRRRWGYGRRPECPTCGTGAQWPPSLKTVTSAIRGALATFHRAPDRPHGAGAISIVHRTARARSTHSSRSPGDNVGAGRARPRDLQGFVQRGPLGAERARGHRQGGESPVLVGLHRETRIAVATWKARREPESHSTRALFGRRSCPREAQRRRQSTGGFRSSPADKPRREHLQWGAARNRSPPLGAVRTSALDEPGSAAGRVPADVRPWACAAGGNGGAVSSVP